MGAEPLDRREFLFRIGVFFFIVGVFSLMIFISTDISRTRLNQSIPLTHTAYAAQAIQTQQAGAQTALAASLPTPTRIRVKDLRATQEFIQVWRAGFANPRGRAKRRWRWAFPHAHSNQPRRNRSLFAKPAEFRLSGFPVPRHAWHCRRPGAVRIALPPVKSAGRFAGIRGWLQKMREARKKREEAKKKKK